MNEFDKIKELQGRLDKTQEHADKACVLITAGGVLFLFGIFYPIVMAVSLVVIVSGVFYDVWVDFSFRKIEKALDKLER